MPSKTSHVLPTRYCLATTNGEDGERLRRMVVSQFENIPNTPRLSRYSRHTWAGAILAA
jgi:hypothetical protein